MKKLKEIFARINKWLARETDLEAYISSKNPQNASDVDYWMERYMKTRHTLFYRG